ncbi:hypothetical protein BDK51DRAFT_11868, partial [Blyttiomyces helicus]
QESYVVLDLGTDINEAMLNAAAASYDGLSFSGLDSSEPYLRVGNMVYRGVVEPTFGTDVIF